MNRWIAVILFVMAPLAGAASLDHILIGVPKLDEGVAAFEKATGVRAQYGGKHPSGGTENALVSLGDGAYLEIIAPRADADANDGLAWYLRSLKEPVLVGWAVRVSDAAAARELVHKNGFEVSDAKPGSRIKPDGKKLEWTTFGVDENAMATAPFFIQWSASTTHPSESSPGGCSLIRFELADPEADDLSRLLQLLGVAVPVRAAERPHMQLQLRCGEREASFASE